MNQLQLNMELKQPATFILDASKIARDLRGAELRKNLNF
jgi:hypothetical protein